MSWRPPTEADLLSGSISGAELSAYRAAALGESQADPVTAQLSTVTNFVRGYISANAENSLGNDGTLPEAVIPAAMDYIAVDIIKRLPGRKIDEARATARKEAIDLFNRIAAGTYKIEQPPTGADPSETMPSSSPSFVSKTRNYQRTNQDGI